jgi:hypothetical protein
MLKWISFTLYGLVCGFYILIWKDVKPESILAYMAVRDALIFNVFMALALIFILNYVWKSCHEGEKKPHVHVSGWFFYISILLGVWTVNVLPSYSSAKDGILKSADGIIAIGILSAFQAWALIFGIVLIAVEFAFYHRKK